MQTSSMANSEHCCHGGQTLDSDSPGACGDDCSGSTEQSDLAVTQLCACRPRLPTGVPGFSQERQITGKAL